MKKVLFVFGTRPEAIKMAPVVRAVQESEGLQSEICVTAQHRQMLDQVLDLFAIEPDYDLNIMKNDQDLYDVTSNVLLGVRDVLERSKPDVVLVHGDTTTTFAASLAAFYRHIDVGHVEAGLRTYNLEAPFPEEANRQLTARLAAWHFAPTERARENLLSERIEPGKIFVTGNSVIDALLLTVERIEGSTELQKELEEIIRRSGFPMDRKRRFLLVTGHRRENFGEGFVRICRALRRLAESYPELDLVYPLHLNPNVRNVVRPLLGDLPNVYLIDPLDYAPFVYLMTGSYLVLTDSGGIQEEAPSLGKPVLVLRETTERPEAVEAGTVELVGTDEKRIVEAVRELLEDPERYERMARAHNPYGDGKTSERIVTILKRGK